MSRYGHVVRCAGLSASSCVLCHVFVAESGRSVLLVAPWSRDGGFSNRRCVGHVATRRFAKLRSASLGGPPHAAADSFPATNGRAGLVFWFVVGQRIIGIQLGGVFLWLVRQLRWSRFKLEFWRVFVGLLGFVVW